MKITSNQLRSLISQVLSEAPARRPGRSAGGVMYLVIGQSGTGSGSLTWPEDFELVGLYHNRTAADAAALEKNGGRPFAEPSEDDDYEDEFEGEWAFEVYELPVLG